MGLLPGTWWGFRLVWGVGLWRGVLDSCVELERCEVIAWDKAWGYCLEWVWDYCLEWGVGLLPGIGCWVIVWDAVQDCCLDWGVDSLLGMGCEVIAWNRVWDYCLKSAVGLGPVQTCALLGSPATYVILCLVRTRSNLCQFRVLFWGPFCWSICLPICWTILGGHFGEHFGTRSAQEGTKMSLKDPKCCIGKNFKNR
jgi:hypothetical protein